MAATAAVRVEIPILVGFLYSNVFLVGGVAGDTDSGGLGLVSVGCGGGVDRVLVVVVG